MNKQVGEKVTVWVRGYRRSIQRVLQEDSQGLFVSYKGKMVRVVKKLDWEDQHDGTYIDKEFIEGGTRGRRNYE